MPFISIDGDMFTTFYDSQDAVTYILANTADGEVVVDDIKYKNREAAFQAQKIKYLEDYKKKDPAEQVKMLQQFATNTWTIAPSTLSDYSKRHYKLSANEIADWNEHSFQEMYNIVHEFSLQNLEFRNTLLATGCSYIVEDTAVRNDNIWGCGSHGKGKNLLGRILMRVRAEIAPSLHEAYNDDIAQEHVSQEAMNLSKHILWKTYDSTPSFIENKLVAILDRDCSRTRSIFESFTINNNTKHAITLGNEIVSTVLIHDINYIQFDALDLIEIQQTIKKWVQCNKVEDFTVNILPDAGIARDQSITDITLKWNKTSSQLHICGKYLGEEKDVIIQEFARNASCALYMRNVGVSREDEPFIRHVCRYFSNNMKAEFAKIISSSQLSQVGHPNNTFVLQNSVSNFKASLNKLMNSGISFRNKVINRDVRSSNPKSEQFIKISFVNDVFTIRGKTRGNNDIDLSLKSNGENWDTVLQHEYMKYVLREYSGNLNEVLGDLSKGQEESHNNELDMLSYIKKLQNKGVKNFKYSFHKGTMHEKEDYQISWDLNTGKVLISMSHINGQTNVSYGISKNGDQDILEQKGYYLDGQDIEGDLSVNKIFPHIVADVENKFVVKLMEIGRDNMNNSIQDKKNNGSIKTDNNVRNNFDDPIVQETVNGLTAWLKLPYRNQHLARCTSEKCKEVITTFIKSKCLELYNKVTKQNDNKISMSVGSKRTESFVINNEQISISSDLSNSDEWLRIEIKSCDTNYTTACVIRPDRFIEDFENFFQAGGDDSKFMKYSGNIIAYIQETECYKKYADQVTDKTVYDCLNMVKDNVNFQIESITPDNPNDLHVSSCNRKKIIGAVVFEAVMGFLSTCAASGIGIGASRGEVQGFSQGILALTIISCIIAISSFIGLVVGALYIKSQCFNKHSSLNEEQEEGKPSQEINIDNTLECDAGNFIS